MKARGPLQLIHDRENAPPDRRPTPEAQRHATYVTAGMRFRKVAVIDAMRANGRLTDQEHCALTHYRDQVALAERSPKSCLDVRSGGGEGAYLPLAVMSAKAAISRMDANLGPLRELVKAVAVDDLTLPQWCIMRYGGRDRYSEDGKLLAVVPINEGKNIKRSREELKQAARKITA